MKTIMNRFRSGIGILVLALGLVSVSACGGAGDQMIDLDPSVSDFGCVADEDCFEGLVCEDGGCVEVVAPENPEAPDVEPEPEPEPEPEAEEPVACTTNDDCENGRCSSETGFCVDQCPMGTFWKTPEGETTGQCQAFGFVAPLDLECQSDDQCQAGFVCENHQCIPEPDPVPPPPVLM